MKLTTIVHCKKSSYDVYIGRPLKWGNPFSIGRDGTRAEVIAKYRAWITKQDHLLKDLPELKDKVLGCWCHPKPCHGHVLIELIEALDEKEISMVATCPNCKSEIRISQGIPEHRSINKQGKEVLRYRCAKCGNTIEVIR
jgi:predicted Zn finger-like uncharacterized protein